MQAALGTAGGGVNDVPALKTAHVGIAPTGFDALVHNAGSVPVIANSALLLSRQGPVLR